MNISFAQEEIEDLLIENPNSSIWSQKMRQRNKLSFLINIVFALILIAFIIYGFIFKSHVPGFFRELSTIIITCYLVVYYTYKNFNIASTLVYSIYPSNVTFEWGLFRKKKVEIPFHDITAIELVTYSDKDISTIHFGTSQNYEIEKIDFDGNDSRPHITFENIKNGREVYALLKYLQNNAKKVIV